MAARSLRAERRSDMLTLQELRMTLDVPDIKMKIPTAKELRESGQIIASKQLGMDAKIYVYQSGFAIYQICGRSTVFSIHSCRDYLYLMDGSMVHLEDCFFEDEKWYLRLVLEGEDRLSRNQEERERSWKVSYSAVSEDWLAMENLEEPMIDYLVKQETVAEVLQILTEKQRTMIQKYYIQGKTQTQISKELGISRLAVRDSISHAIRKIQKKYSPKNYQCGCRAECGVGR